MNAFANFPADEPLREKLDAGIWVEPKDKDPRDERDRQIRAVNKVKRCPEIAYHAVPNGGKQTDWMRTNAERMGVVAGELDLGFAWLGGGGRIEMKDGVEMPRQNQIERMNQLYRMGVNVAVCRTPEGVMGRLKAWGAPVDRAL